MEHVDVVRGNVIHEIKVTGEELRILHIAVGAYNFDQAEKRGIERKELTKLYAELGKMIDEERNGF